MFAQDRMGENNASTAYMFWVCRLVSVTYRFQA